MSYQLYSREAAGKALEKTYNQTKVLDKKDVFTRVEYTWEGCRSRSYKSSDVVSRSAPDSEVMSRCIS